MAEQEKTTSTEAAPAPTENANPPKEMRCITLQGFGGIKNVRLQKRPEPEPKEGEVMIRVQTW